MAHILILEDDLDFGQLLAAALKTAGHKVVVRTDAGTATEYLNASAVDLVVSDIIVKKDGLPVPEGGIIFTHRVKEAARKRGVEIPVIAISGAKAMGSGVDVLSSATGVGADAVFQKPFPPKELLDTIERLLST